MNIGFYTASQGLFESQKAMDITSNNVANIQTNGFKPLRPSFSDLMYTVRNPEKENVEVGHGTKIGKTDLMFDKGTLVNTNRTLDFAISGEQLFAVQAPNGDVKYTKDGAFYLSEGADTMYIVDAEGNFVLDAELNPVSLQYNEADEVDYAATNALIGAFKFPNPYGLRPDGDNEFLETASSGAAVADENAEIKNGFLEVSSADMADQMVKIIQYQKAFSFNAKMVQTADDLQNLVNNLR